MHLLLIVQIKNLGCYPSAFFIVAVTAVHIDAVPGFIGSPDHFFNLIFVLGNDTIRCVDNILSGSVILFQFIKAVIRIILLEVEDVLDVRSPKPINGLGIISYNT